MTCKTYIGTPHRESVSGQSLVTVCNGQKSEPLPLRLDLFNHSPTGFGWGYGGSGPAQLALALLADALGDDDRAPQLHQEFKFKVAACWPEGERWWITTEQIAAVVDRAEEYSGCQEERPGSRKRSRCGLDHDGSFLYPREVLRRALELHATGCVLAHNHPSGDATPSRADIDMTKQVIEVCGVLGIAVHDHVIITRDGHSSLRGLGLM
jgi:RadC-like JAB domain/Family of unknown function (DUF6166)